MVGNPNPKLGLRKPEAAFTKPLKADFKELFKALSKGIGHTLVGKWEELGTDTVESLSAIGLSTEPGELAFLLIRRSITKALFELVGDSACQSLVESRDEAETLLEHLTSSAFLSDVHLDHKFLDRPAELPLIEEVRSLFQHWLEAHGMVRASALAIAGRLPSYFVYALNQEWRRNSKSYRPLAEAMNTPFAKAGDREWAWTAYAALLQRRVQEGIFDEPFSLDQLFVPLNAYFPEETEGNGSPGEIGRPGRNRRRIVVSLQRELEQWLELANPQDVIRVISGGPGSGKSSFARIFAARLSAEEKAKVLFVPLHLIDPGKDLVEEVGRFVKDEGVLLQNPLDPDSPEPNLLIIFDGLDELASQGKAAAETARSFVREVERTVEKRNLQKVRIRILISGRELAVQENESEFRRPRQILTLLPYFVAQQDRQVRGPLGAAEEYVDKGRWLRKDLRQEWWKRYGSLTGKGYEGLPQQLNRGDLEEVTAQPLLNYLVALSFSRKKLDFSKDINLNSVYADLVAAVHERGYEKRRPYAPIRHMCLADFTRVLEEIGLAAWHGDGRTTTVREIEEHCRASGLGVLLDVFQEGAKTGVTRLLAAFFFRQYGRRASGDRTFIFTHKSFGEFLTARRVVRSVERIIRELERREKNPDEGWDQREALRYWAQICGPSAISRYLFQFLVNEMQLRAISDVTVWQDRLTKVFAYMLRHGMPMEQLQVSPFREALFQSRNSEEALLAALNACARVTGRVSLIDAPDPTLFGTWFRRIQGQRTGPESVLAANCLSFLDLSGSSLDITDFYGSDLRASNLQGIQAHYSSFGGSNLMNADLRGALFYGARLESANLRRANLAHAMLNGAFLANATLEEANLKDAHLVSANLEDVDLRGANLAGAKFTRANLKGANLEGANCEGADFESAHLEGTRLSGAKFFQGKLFPT